MVNEIVAETNFIKAFIDNKNKGTPVTNRVMPGIRIYAAEGLWNGAILDRRSNGEDWDGWS